MYTVNFINNEILVLEPNRHACMEVVQVILELNTGALNLLRVNYRNGGYEPMEIIYYCRDANAH